MEQAKVRSRGRLLTTVGAIGFLLAVISVAMVVAAGMGFRHFMPPLVAFLIPWLGAFVAMFVWNRSARDLAAMARGDMDRSSRQSTRIAWRLGKAGFMIAALLILGVTLFVVAGYVLLGPSPSGP